jgi:hypothetical protein
MLLPCQWWLLLLLLPVLLLELLLLLLQRLCQRSHAAVQPR